MLGTYSFECPSCGAQEDRFVHRDSRNSQECGNCGDTMKQVIRYAPKLDWYGMAMGESAGPEFIDRFEKDHKNRKAYEDKMDQEHGDYGPAAGA